MWNDTTKDLLRKAAYAALVAAVLAFAKTIGIVVPMPTPTQGILMQSAPCQCEHGK
jgi:hypothetical protein